MQLRHDGYMATITKSLARKLAVSVKTSEWEAARDRVDTLTDGDLDATQLDMLTDWVIEACQQ